MEDNLTFDKAVQLTTQLETADKELPGLHGARSHSTVTTTASVQYTHGKQPSKGVQRTNKIFKRGLSSNIRHQELVIAVIIKITGRHSVLIRQILVNNTEKKAIGQRCVKASQAMLQIKAQLVLYFIRLQVLMHLK